ncbi:hypothetical protein B0H13DRAFT_1909758 [Mycena leptocephala]|nr:hypothetical protein B0H13DRAFT_1909758 [Mycena leptocephala]
MDAGQGRASEMRRQWTQARGEARSFDAGKEIQAKAELRGSKLPGEDELELKRAADVLCRLGERASVGSVKMIRISSGAIRTGACADAVSPCRLPGSQRRGKGMGKAGAGMAWREEPSPRQHKGGPSSMRGRREEEGFEARNQGARTTLQASSLEADATPGTNGTAGAMLALARTQSEPVGSPAGFRGRSFEAGSLKAERVRRGGRREDSSPRQDKGGRWLMVEAQARDEGES